MPRRLSAVLAVVLLALAVPCVALARGEEGAHVLAGQAGPLYVGHVTLTGKAAKPRGELQGVGSITICVDRAANSISFAFDQLRVTGQPTAGHIHVGAVGIAGPVVFAFSVPGAIDPTVGDVQWYDTAKASKGTISALVSSPKKYYVNVHTKKYPNGAVRGQLGSWKSVQPQDPSAAVCGAG